MSSQILHTKMTVHNVKRVTEWYNRRSAGSI